MENAILSVIEETHRTVSVHALLSYKHLKTSHRIRIGFKMYYLFGVCNAVKHFNLTKGKLLELSEQCIRFSRFRFLVLE